MVICCIWMAVCYSDKEKESQSKYHIDLSEHHYHHTCRNLVKTPVESPAGSQISVQHGTTEQTGKTRKKKATLRGFFEAFLRLFFRSSVVCVLY